MNDSDVLVAAITAWWAVQVAKIIAADRAAVRRAKAAAKEAKP